MDARSEMQELQRRFEQSPHSDEFMQLRRASKWGERIREEVIKRIEQHRPEAIEDGILFLEENPRYFRTGYFKAAIASKLKSAPLTPDQQHRLLQVILRAITTADVGPEFNEYARLAAIIATPEFVKRVVGTRDNSSDWSRQRCERLLSHCPTA